MLISISTHKGGAGKTTIATNIACALAKMNKSKTVCLVDLDGQCGVNIIFGKSPNKYIDNSILSIINNQKQLKEVIFNDLDKSIEMSNLYIIHSEPNLRGFDHIINNNFEIKDNLTKTLKFLKNNFDYVIVDTPPAFSTINILTFMVSDMIVSPFEPERQNIEGSLAVIKELKKPQYENNPLILLLPIKVKENTIIDKMLLQYMEDIISLENNENDHVFISTYKIPNSTQYKTTSAREKLPLIISNNKSKAVKTQIELINAITVEIQDKLEWLKELKR